MITIQDIFISVNLKVTIFCRQFRICFTADQALMLQTIFNDISNRNNGQILFFCKLQQLCGTHHGSVLTHDLTAQSTWF